MPSTFKIRQCHIKIGMMTMARMMTTDDAHLSNIVTPGQVLPLADQLLHRCLVVPFHCLDINRSSSDQCSETSSTSIRAPARLVSSPTEKQRSYPRPNIFGGTSGLQVLCQPIRFVAEEKPDVRILSAAESFVSTLSTLWLILSRLRVLSSLPW